MSTVTAATPVYLALLGGEAALGVRQHLTVANVQRLDPPLLAEREPDEEAKLHQLRVGEVRVQPFPEGVVGETSLPDDGAGVGQRGLLALRKLVRCGEVQQLGILRLRNAPRSRPDRTLRPSILALDGL